MTRHDHSIFKKLVKRLLEADEPKPLLPSEEGTDSVDSQIDKFFVNYESEAKSSKNEGLDLRFMTRRFLTEAGEDEEDEEGDDESSDEDEEDDAEGDEGDEGDEEPEEPEKLTSEDIDVNSFAASVARLVDNYDSLLEIRNTVLRRASAFIAKSYDQETVDMFKDVMSNDYDMDIAGSAIDKSEEYPAPKAGFAGPAGGGGGA
jgi:hypothetical protein